jgi:hypothetical protein
MSKKLSIINAGNIYAQNLLKTVSGFNKVSLGDVLNSRKSVKKKKKNENKNKKKKN